jgi:hypothetical protein
MNRLMQRMAIVGSAFVLAAGAAVGGASAAPALATVYPCADWAYAQPTPMHTWYTDSSPSEYLLNAGTEVGSNCDYFNNTSEGRWYMAAWYDGTLGYIWVQRLDYGRYHECYLTHNQTTTSIGSNLCPLYPESPGSGVKA